MGRHELPPQQPDMNPADEPGQEGGRHRLPEEGSESSPHLDRQESTETPRQRADALAAEAESAQRMADQARAAAERAHQEAGIPMRVSQGARRGPGAPRQSEAPFPLYDPSDEERQRLDQRIAQPTTGTHPNERYRIEQQRDAAAYIADVAQKVAAAGASDVATVRTAMGIHSASVIAPEGQSPTERALEVAAELQKDRLAWGVIRELVWRGALTTADAELDRRIMSAEYDSPLARSFGTLNPAYHAIGSDFRRRYGGTENAHDGQARFRIGSQFMNGKRRENVQAMREQVPSDAFQQEFEYHMAQTGLVADSDGNLYIGHYPHKTVHSAADRETIAAEKRAAAEDARDRRPQSVAQIVEGVSKFIQTQHLERHIRGTYMAFPRASGRLRRATDRLALSVADDLANLWGEDYARKLAYEFTLLDGTDRDINGNPIRPTTPRKTLSQGGKLPDGDKYQRLAAVYMEPSNTLALGGPNAMRREWTSQTLEKAFIELEARAKREEEQQRREQSRQGQPADDQQNADQDDSRLSRLRRRFRR